MTFVLTPCKLVAMKDKVHSNIYLVGPMGSGKTTIGQRLAKLLGKDFYDSDRELEAQTGASVNLIFDVEGEAGFRIRETHMLEELTSRSNILLATGGGVILKSENRELLRRTGLVVYLQVSVQQQLNRLSRDRSRPLLQCEDREEKLHALARARNPLYEAVADIVFPSLNRGPGVAARILAGKIQNLNKAGARAGAAQDGQDLST
jgi:shikimate kinase